MSRVLRSGLAIVALLLSLLLVPAVAGAAPDLGNSQAAKACQQGGYLNFRRTDGTAFTNTGDCASYAAQGGILVPVVQLPDLLPKVTCVNDATAHIVTCTVSIINVGTVTVTEPVRLQTSITGTNVNNASIAFSSTACTTVNASLSTTAGLGTGGATGDVTCGGTIAPGDEVGFTLVLGAGTAAAGTPLAVAATADPGNTIVESNEDNNTYNATITTP